MEFCGMKREIDRKCLNHARVHANAQSFDRCEVGPMIWDNFSIFRTNCAIGCGTRAYIAARIFADVAQGKWRPTFPKSFMLLAHNSRPLWQLEFCLSIFAVSCSSLSEDNAEFRYVQVEFRCSFYKNFTLLQSKFQI